MSQRLKTMQKQNKLDLKLCLQPYISLIMPIQVHPISYDTWRQWPTSMVVVATIDAARIIGLPRVKPIDLKTEQLNEINMAIITTFSSEATPRKEFLQTYFK